MSKLVRTSAANTPSAREAINAGDGAQANADKHADHARRAMTQLCSALGELLESLPGHPPRATDVANVLRINPQLAWQVFRMAGAADSLAAVQFLPTSNQLARVIEAARVAGSKSSAVKNAKAACAALDAFLAEHAMDRREFESLVGSMAGGGAEQVDIKHRRAIHRGHAHFYGIQAQAIYCCNVLHPGEAGGGYRQVSMLGYVGLHTLRPDVPMTLLQKAGAKDPDGNPIPTPNGANLLDGFGTRQRVELVHEGEEDGRVITRIVFPGIGRGAAISFLSAQDFSDANVQKDTHPWLTVQITVPVEAIVLDLLVPSAWRTSDEVVVRTYARRAKPSKVFEYRSVDLIPSNERATCTRGVTTIAPATGIPGAREVVGRVLRERGWGETHFDHYRCRVAFPVLYSAIRMEALPPRERHSG